MTLASYCPIQILMTLKTILNTVFKILSAWFKQNLLSLNFTKTQFTNFTTKNNNQIEININYNNKFIPTITYKKFLSLTVHCSLTWINHIVYFYFEDHLSFPFSLNYVLWHNILGKLIT